MRILGKLNNLFGKKFIAIVLGGLLIILLIAGSYAAWYWDDLGESNLISAESVEIEFLESDGEVINLEGAFPVIDSVGMAQEDTFDFQVKTKTKKKMDISYSLYIEKLEADSGYSVLQDKEVKVYLTDFSNNVKVAPTKVSDLNNYVLYNGINSHSETSIEQIDKYKLRVWVDEEVKAGDWDENTKLQYKFKIGVRAIEKVVNQCNEVSILSSGDVSGANPPVLSDNMIPVYYDTCDETWKKADESNNDTKYMWYDYDSKIWGNSVTVSSENRNIYLDAKPGTEIPMDDILTMQVWIPRYKYTVWNYNNGGEVTSEPQQISIEFEKGITTTGEVSCMNLENMGTSDGTKNGVVQITSEVCKLKSNNVVCTDSLCNGKTYTHPGFTMGKEELEGFWMGKFEVSSDINCTPGEENAIGEGCNLNTIRPLVKPNVLSWRGAMVSVFENNMMDMNDAGNKYGFVSYDDTHMAKNMEWGAVTYLSHSKYGICTDGECVKVRKNAQSDYTTGCGPHPSASYGSACSLYDTILGQSASTTGNIYGVYDMAGGSYEYTMGVIASPDGITMMSGENSNNIYSGYSGILYYDGDVSAGFGFYNGLYEFPNSKYYDIYSFNVYPSTKGLSKLGDGLKEVSIGQNYGWYNTISYLPRSMFPWIYRGGDYSDGVIFFSAYKKGSAYGGYSSRLVISLVS